MVNEKPTNYFLNLENRHFTNKLIPKLINEENSNEITNPPFTHRRRFFYDQRVAENMADHDKSQEKPSGVFISAVGSS